MIMNKTYIIMGAAGGYISGGPIYHRNKALYMQSLGWNVFYITSCGGKILVDGLEKFIVAQCTFLCRPPYMLPKRKQKKMIDYIIKKLPSVNTYQLVIETGTYYTSYWGELLARRLHGKHIIVYLDEHNDGILHRDASFFKFKFDRRELACISPNAMIDIFGKYWNIDLNETVSVPCECTNVIEDIESCLNTDIPIADYTIGYIGRLEKKEFTTICNALMIFAKMVGDKKIVFVCFGDSTLHNSAEILSDIRKVKNIDVFVTGFIYPIPLQAIRKCDLCVSSAGSATVSCKAGVPTIRMDVYSDKPMGFMKEVGCSDYVRYPNGDKLVDYLKSFFIENDADFSISPYDISNDAELLTRNLDKHLSFLHLSVKEKTYYDFSKVRLTRKEKLCILLNSILGNRLYDILKN